MDFDNRKVCGDTSITDGLVEERVRLEFTVCTNSSHFCTFISNNIIPRYPDHSIPMLRIQYVDFNSGTGVSDPDKVLSSIGNFLSPPLRYSTTGPNIGYTYRISQLI